MGKRVNRTFKVAMVSMSKLCQNRFSFLWRCDFAILIFVVVCDCELQQPNFKSTEVCFHFPALWLLCNHSVIEESINETLNICNNNAHSRECAFVNARVLP